MEDNEQHHPSPAEASRTSLDELAHEHPRHPTTEHEKGPHAGAPQPTEPPGEQHRGGPLPYMKR